VWSIVEALKINVVNGQTIQNLPNVAAVARDSEILYVLSHLPSLLRLIYDPATGKPRGFGFCEYEDAETAMSAVRNLAGRELNGRPLRIDSATNAPGEGFRRE